MKILKSLHAFLLDRARARRISILLDDLAAMAGHYPAWIIEEIETEIRTLTNERIGARVNTEHAA